MCMFDGAHLNLFTREFTLMLITVIVWSGKWKSALKMEALGELQYETGRITMTTRKQINHLWTAKIFMNDFFVKKDREASISIIVDTLWKSFCEIISGKFFILTICSLLEEIGIHLIYSSINLKRISLHFRSSSWWKKVQDTHQLPQFYDTQHRKNYIQIFEYEPGDLLVLHFAAFLWSHRHSFGDMHHFPTFCQVDRRDPSSKVL